jgi:hypothetical protein
MNLNPGIKNQKTSSNLLILHLRNSILSASFLFVIESLVDLVTLDFRGNRFNGYQKLFLINNDLSDNVPPRLYDLHLDFFVFYSCTVDECNCGVLNPSTPDTRNLHEFRKGSIYLIFYFPRFTNVEKLQNDEKDVTNIHYSISSVWDVISMQAVPCYTTTNGSSHSSLLLYVSAHLFMWWLTLLGVTTSKKHSRLFTTPAIKQGHMNAAFRYIMFFMIIICAYKIPVRVNGAFSRSSKLLANDGAASDCFGHSNSIYGTTAIIGAYGDDDKATNAGMNKNVTKTVRNRYILVSVYVKLYCVYRKCVCVWIYGKYLVSSI